MLKNANMPLINRKPSVVMAALHAHIRNKHALVNETAEQLSKFPNSSALTIALCVCLTLSLLNIQ